MILPRQNFSLLSEVKCGTSSLYALLAGHPEICLSRPKEPWFVEEPELFSYYSSNQFQSYYDTYYPHYQGQSLLGDFNPRKCRYPWGVQLLSQLMPEGKVIMLFRDPVRRAYSEWWMQVCAGVETLNFEEAIQANLEELRAGIAFDQDEQVARRLLPAWLSSQRQRTPLPTRLYLNSGYYWRGVERAYQLFGRERVWVATLEQLRVCPQQTCQSLLEFLGVSQQPLDVNRVENRAPGLLTRRAYGLARQLKLSGLLPVPLRTRLSEGLKKLLYSLGDRSPQLAPATAAQISALYTSDNQKLEQLTGLDLSSWAG